MRTLSGVTAVVVFQMASCGGSQAPVAVAPKPAEVAAPIAPPRPTCPAVVDVADLFARHARSFGSPAGVVPRALRMEVTAQGKTGVRELVLRPAGSRLEEAIGDAFTSAGVDDRGAWELSDRGVLLRLRPDESAGVALTPWLARRAYLTDFDAKRDTAVCATGETPRVTVRFNRPDLGTPALELDWTTAALLSVVATNADGTPSTTRFEAWSDPDARGVRWPASMTEADSLGNTSSVRLVADEVGPACKGARASDPGGIDCLAPPAPPLAFEWPAKGSVRVPMKHYLGELSIRVKLDGKDTWAVPDSGAGLTAIDATSPSAKAFVLGREINGGGSTEMVQAGLDTVDTLGVGGLTLRHLPVVSEP